MEKVVFIGVSFPEKNATAAGWRIHQLIDFFEKRSYEIYFLATSEYTEKHELNAIITFKINLNCSSFDDLIKNINPKMVIFDRFLAEEQFGWRISEQCPLAIKILDTEDLHFLRKRREDLYLRNKISNKTQDIFKRELASILRCDLSLIISKYEYELLVKTYKVSEKQLFYLPFVYEDNKLLPDVNFDNRKNFIFIGNFLHEPNWQTVLVLKSIWTEIRRQLPDAELHIYGAYVPEKAKSLQDKKNGFLMKGRAENVEQLFQDYKVLLAPIPYGAGLKGKLFESMSFGLPNVTSEMGAEGLFFDNQWNGFIANDLTDDFIEKAVLLYQNKSIWHEKLLIGYKILKDNFNVSNFESLFFERLETINNDLESHRNEHCLIEILNHQSMQSTKYMSKWIEEKNKSSEA